MHDVFGIATCAGAFRELADHGLVALEEPDPPGFALARPSRGEASAEFAKAAETEAAKFLLLKGAVNFYARGEQYEKAAEAVTTLQREIKDVPPAVIAEITGKATGKISEAKAPELYALYRTAKLQVRAGDEAEALAAKLKKAQSDALQRKYAEALAVSGDWKSAYAGFAKVRDAKLQAIVKDEASGNVKSVDAGEFWWGYEPAMEDTEEFFKSHAAAFYRRALDAGEITGLKKNIIEQRVKSVANEVVSFTEDQTVVKTKPSTKDDEKVFLEVVSAIRKNGGNVTERTRTVISKMFPGWSLDTDAGTNDMGGFTDQHRGKTNVFFSHPTKAGGQMIMSRTMKLTGKNPCLFLNIASHDWGSDCLLAIRVNDKYALPTRFICTPDSAPWQDLIVPLSDWRGQTVKIEIIHTANNWWCEHLFFSRIEIAEGKGDMRIIEGQEKVGAYTWSYRAQNGVAEIVDDKDGKVSRAVSPPPKGQLIIPATIGGAKITRLGWSSFNGCTELTSVKIPSDVKSLGRAVFWDCKNLQAITIPAGVQGIERDTFGKCAALKKIVLPEGVKHIGESAFWHCNCLTDVILPSGLTTIGRNAFGECTGLKTVAIPAGVKVIVSGAFRRCRELESVTMLGERPDAPENVFEGCDKLKAIHVPAKAKSWSGMTEWLGKPLVFDAKK